jgi:transposase
MAAGGSDSREACDAGSGDVLLPISICPLQAQEDNLTEQFVLAVDPHKASWTAAVVDHAHRVRGQLRVPASREGYRQLRGLARRWPAGSLIWAVEGAHGLGLPLVERLAADGIPVVDVPAKLSARVRLLATGNGRKTDAADAVATAVAALTAARLRTAAIDEHTATLRLLSDHRDDLVRARTQTLNRLHVLLVGLVPAGAPRHLTADTAAGLLRSVRSRTPAEQTRRALARDLVAEVRRLDERIAALDTMIGKAVATTASTLPELCGIGVVLAGKLLGRVGAITRFGSAAAFAAYCGVAPIEASSGDVVRHRLCRAGDRQLNFVLHVMAITQIRCHSPAQAYYLRKRAEGKGRKEALRCLKRRLADVVYRTMLRDATTQTTATT